MCGKKNLALSLSITFVGFLVLLLFILSVSPAHAQPAGQEIDNGTCISCHEDLYFLHDTGNYFCIREAPMRCVDCHGGNSEATTPETAHFDRAAHPIVNEDISKCQECHVNEDECCQCVSKFDQLAGLREVKLISPVPYSRVPNQTTGMPVFEEEASLSAMFTREALPLFVMTGLALVIYILHRLRHP